MKRIPGNYRVKDFVIIFLEQNTQELKCLRTVLLFGFGTKVLLFGFEETHRNQHVVVCGVIC